jgi:hypothetical protein
MTHTISAAKNGQYIIIKVTGTIDRALALQYNLEAHALGARLGIRRYLMDLRGCRNTDTTFNSYRFAYQDIRETVGLNLEAQVAMLVDPADHSHDFVETLALNTGRLTKLFRELEAALAYLEVT